MRVLSPDMSGVLAGDLALAALGVCISFRMPLMLGVLSLFLVRGETNMSRGTFGVLIESKSKAVWFMPGVPAGDPTKLTPNLAGVLKLIFLPLDLGVFGDLETGVFLALAGLGVAAFGVDSLAGVFLGVALGADGLEGVFFPKDFGVAAVGVARLAGVFLGVTLGVAALGVEGLAGVETLGVATFATLGVADFGVDGLAGDFLGVALGVAAFTTLGVAAFGVEGFAGVDLGLATFATLGVADFGVDGLAGDFLGVALGVAVFAALTGDFFPGVTTLTGDFFGVFLGETLTGVLAGVFLGEALTGVALAGVLSLAGVGILLGVLCNLAAGLAGVLKGEPVFLTGETLRALTGVATINLCLLLGGAEMSLPGV